MPDTSFVRTEMLPPQAPPPGETGIVHWLRENLFSSVLNTVLTLLSLYVIWVAVSGVGPWLWRGIWNANSLAECRQIRDQLYGPGTSVACWAFIPERWSQLLFGFYPQGGTWRPVVALVLTLAALAPILFPALPRRLVWGAVPAPFILFFLLWGGSLWGPIVVAAGFVLAGAVLRFASARTGTGAAILLACLAAGGYFLYLDAPLTAWLVANVPMLSLPEVTTREFGGFTLSFVIGISGIVLSLPLGILLALGRQSEMFIIQKSCVAFIEVIRGVPLIVWLFTASLLLNYFLPPGVTFDLMLRVIIMVTLFSSAYIAEVVRGGLAALPRGQYEAAYALGLDYWKAMRLVILPQALKISIPGIVSSFIGLFKDTTLVSFVGLLDPINLANSIRSSEAWHGVVWEIYIFIGVIFFIACYAMSRYAAWLERRLQRDHR
jgi:general L-amino acid transport system permease protein